MSDNLPDGYVEPPNHEPCAYCHQMLDERKTMDALRSALARLVENAECEDVTDGVTGERCGECPLCTALLNAQRALATPADAQNPREMDARAPVLDAAAKSDRGVGGAQTGSQRVDAGICPTCGGDVWTQAELDDAKAQAAALAEFLPATDPPAAPEPSGGESAAQTHDFLFTNEPDGSTGCALCNQPEDAHPVTLLSISEECEHDVVTRAVCRRCGDDTFPTEDDIRSVSDNCGTFRPSAAELTYRAGEAAASPQTWPDIVTAAAIDDGLAEAELSASPVQRARSDGDVTSAQELSAPECNGSGLRVHLYSEQAVTRPCPGCRRCRPCEGCGGKNEPGDRDTCPECYGSGVENKDGET